MRSLICLMILQLIFYSSTQNGGQQTDIWPEDFPGNWILLSELEGEMIIFNPCDAANGRISIDQAQMEVSEGHDGLRFEVISCTKIREDNYQFELRNGEEIIYYYFTCTGQNGDRGYWGMDPETPGALYIAEEASHTVRVIDQPCEECWDDCE